MFVQKKHIVNMYLLAGLIASAFNTTVAPAQDANTWCNQNGQYHPCNLDKALVKEEFHETYPLTPTGHVLIENINGRVHILAWDRDQVKVDVVKSGETRDQLKDAEIDVDSQRDSISIRTKHERLEASHPYFASNHVSAVVEYTITVPREARLDNIHLTNGDLDITDVAGLVRARCVNGKLVANGLRHNAELSTVNNSLEARFDTLAADSIELGSVNGGVKLILPSDARASLQATAVRGDIANEFGLHASSGLTGDELRGELGGGGTKIRLISLNGRIEIDRVSDRNPKTSK
jgi:DUF4097 and DUF4098 domain-containing protein YvlB